MPLRRCKSTKKIPMFVKIIGINFYGFLWVVMAGGLDGC